MNTNELIEATGERLKNARITFQESDSLDGSPEAQAERDTMDYFDSVLVALLSTIPRDTATCPPTGKDADKGGLVFTFLVAPISGATQWAVSTFESVRNDPKFNRFWLPIPTQPEVEK